jgi:hypothetical protein
MIKKMFHLLLIQQCIYSEHLALYALVIVLQSVLEQVEMEFHFEGITLISSHMWCFLLRI